MTEERRKEIESKMDQERKAKAERSARAKYLISTMEKNDVEDLIEAFKDAVIDRELDVVLQLSNSFKDFNKVLDEAASDFCRV